MAGSGDAAQVAPDVYKVVFENARVRVLEVQMRPGAKSAMHFHPDYVVHALTPVKVRFTAGDGSSQEAEFPAGVLWRDAEEHAVENISDADLRAVFIELK
jgi:quercetin dioxygenase-like cupin family protein